MCLLYVYTEYLMPNMDSSCSLSVLGNDTRVLRVPQEEIVVTMKVPLRAHASALEPGHSISQVNQS